MDLLEIKKFIRDFEDSSLNAIELEIEGMKLKLNKQGNVEAARPVLVEELKDSFSNRIASKKRSSEPVRDLEPKQLEISEELTSVKSPLVGTYYSSPSPDDAPFVKVGDTVQKGQVLCIIEAMKIMNEITSPVDGVVKEMHIKNGDTVGYEQLILGIE